MVFAKKIKKQVGFTAVEILVSAFIIALISGLLLVNYHSTNKRSELIMAAQKLASDIRLAQSYALGSKEFNGNVPAGGWGISFYNNASYYYFFADDGDFNYEAGEKFKTVNLPEGIKSFSLPDKDIVFSPPNPITYINGNANSNATIRLNDGETDKSIEINSLGLVDVVY